MRKAISAIVIAATMSFSASSGAMAQDKTPAPGPNDLTWAQVAELKKTSGPTITSSIASDVRAAIQSCTVNMGNIYFRLSGEDYPNGAIGVKPVLKCTAVMPFISMSTTLYKKVWWGLQYQTGPVTTAGSFVQQIQTKNILQPCMNRKYSTNFYAVTTSNMTFTGGSTATGSAFQEATLDCATF